MSGDIDCHTTSMVGRDAAQHFTVCRTVLHNKELAVQDVSRAKVGKPCSKGNKIS